MNRSVAHLGFNALLASASVHQINLSHGTVIHGEDHPVARPELGVPTQGDAPQIMAAAKDG